MTSQRYYTASGVEQFLWSLEGHKTLLCSFIKSFCIYTTGDDLNQLVDGHSYSLSLSYWLYTTHVLNRGDTITIMLYAAMYMKYIVDFVGFSLYGKKTYGFYFTDRQNM